MAGNFRLANGASFFSGLQSGYLFFPSIVKIRLKFVLYICTCEEPGGGRFSLLI
jgi:hypothetical protein